MTDPHNDAPPPPINHIADALRPLARSIETLTLDPKNVRLHPDASIRSIAASLAQFGQQKPIVVDPGGLVLAGNGTVLAAVSLGWTELACSEMDASVPTQRAYALSDNRLAELSEWHRPRVVEQMTTLLDVAPHLAASTGFTDDAIAALRVELENEAARQASGAMTTASAAPPIVETVVFDSAKAKATVDAFLRALGKTYPDPPTPGSRLVAFLRDRGDLPRSDTADPTVGAPHDA